jgi:hypothetical protein
VPWRLRFVLLSDLCITTHLLRRRDLLALLVLLLGGPDTMLERPNLVPLVLDGLLGPVQQVVVLHYHIHNHLAVRRDLLPECQEAVLNLASEVEIQNVRWLVACDGIRRILEICQIVVIILCALSIISFFSEVTIRT